MTLTRKKPSTLALDLKFNSQGESLILKLTYNNKSQKELEAYLDTPQTDVTDSVLFVLKEWDCEYPLTKDGLIEAEGDRPGLIKAIMKGFYFCREGEATKN